MVARVVARGGGQEWLPRVLAVLGMVARGGDQVLWPGVVARVGGQG
jgi:hypothetical protein